jgi:hypothetical protein
MSRPAPKTAFRLSQFMGAASQADARVFALGIFGRSLPAAIDEEPGSRSMLRNNTMGCLRRR